MFKRLKERLVEEANKHPVAQHAFGTNSGKPPEGNVNIFSVGAAKENAEDLIISESSSIIVPHSSSDNFSIADEDGFLSDQNSPQKEVTNSSIGSEMHSTTSTPDNECLSERKSRSSLMPTLSPAFVPTTDIESEVEEPPTLNLEDISKEQLLSAIGTLKARLCKYRNKYSEVVKAYKGINDEKKKLEHTLTENQDRTLRRMAELREQYQLEQKAKADLEGNLRMDLDEKESKISALKTQITLLKEGKPDIDLLEGTKQFVTSGSMTDEEISSRAHKSSSSEEYETKLASKTEEIDEITKENLALKIQLQALTNVSEAFEEKENKLHSEHETIVELLKQRLEELTHQQESSDMSMAEIKQNMHKELELKEDQLKKLKEERHQLRVAVQCKTALNDDMKMQYDTKVKELKSQLETMERTMEEDKQLHISVSRKKSDAVALMQQEHEKKITALEENWKKKVELLQRQQEIDDEAKVKHEEALRLKITQIETECHTVTEEFNNVSSELTELHKQKEDLEKQLNQLKCTKEDLLGKVAKEKSQRLSLQQELEKKTSKAEDIELKEHVEEHLDELFLEERVSDLASPVETTKKECERRIKDIDNKLSDLKLHICALEENGEEDSSDVCSDSSTELGQKESIQDLRKNFMFLEVHRKVEIQMLNFITWQLKKRKMQPKKKIEERFKVCEPNCQAVVEKLNSQIHELQSDNHKLELVIEEFFKLNRELDAHRTDHAMSIEDLHNEIFRLKKHISDLEKNYSHAFHQKEADFLCQLKLKDEEFQIISEKEAVVALKCANYEESIQTLEKKVISFEESHTVKVQSLNETIKERKQEIEMFQLKAKEKSELCEIQCQSIIEQLNVKIQQLQQKNREMEYGEERLLEINKELDAAKVNYEKQIENFYNEISGLKKEKTLEIATRTHLEQELVTLRRSRDSEIVELTNAVKQLNDEKEQFRIQAKEKYEACESQCKPVIEQLNAKIQQLQDQSGELEVVKAEILKTTTEFDASRTDYEKQINDFHNKIFELKNEIEHLENNNSENISKLKQKEVELISQLELKDEEYQAILTEKEKSFSWEFMTQKESIQVLEEKAVSLEKAHDAEISIMKGNIKQLTQEIEQLKIEENEKVQACESRCKSIIEQLNSEVQQLQNKNEEMKMMKIEHEGCKENESRSLGIGTVLQDYQNSNSVQELPDVESNQSQDEDLVDKFNRENRLEISALRSAISEKDSALDEVREHYELIIQKKDETIKELESRSVAQRYGVAGESIDTVSNELSDWDDTWVVPEETCENSTPISNDETTCNHHVKQIETMQEELDRCNSEIKDLKILLHLTPPQSLECSSPFLTSDRLLCEPTEIEYLRNILYKYMMGTETETLVKVIAAVLKFTDEQTKMVIEKAKTVPK